MVTVFVRLAFCCVGILALGPALYAQAMEEMADDDMMMADDGMMMGEEQFSPADLAFFESKVRPLLISACGACHMPSGGRLRGGLNLETREHMLLGGNEGPAIIPGDPNASLLIRAVRYEDIDFEMPPRGQLSRDEVKTLEDWVARGAPFPATEASNDTGVAPGTAHRWTEEDVAEGREHWAYVPLLTTPPVRGDRDDWAWGDLDRFVLMGMKSKGTTPVRDVDNLSWLRRVTFDLTGLPPTRDEIDSFSSSVSKNAHTRVVDRLLDSDAFGERWGRHWLDVARYAESSGKETNVIYPHAWRYRDYVIDAFNDDKPFEAFVLEQLAGDLLPATSNADRAENLIATGYLAIGVKGHNTRGRAQFTADVIDEQINTVTQGLLATTVACARCHDHKFDPIPQRDYYAMAGIFGSTDTRFGTKRHQGNNHTSATIKLPEAESVSSGATIPNAVRTYFERENERATSQLETRESVEKLAKEARRNGRDIPANIQRQIVQLRRASGTAETTKSVLERFDSRGNPTVANRVCVGTLEGKPMNAPMLERGEITRAGERIPRGFVQVISGDWTPSIKSGSGRLELAKWIADEDNPLTARVWANRAWLHLFGNAIVTTPDNFGRSGRAPTNPHLLDYLANQFVEGGGSTKKLIREIVLSHAYRLSSEGNQANEAIDPEASSIWRMPKRRLEAEAIRDAMVATTGKLELSRPAGSVANMFEGVNRGTQQGQASMGRLAMQDFETHRSVYLPIFRDNVIDSLAIFDYPDPSFVTGARATTNVATQALYLMNSADIIMLADDFASRILRENRSFRDRITSAFLLAFARAPSANEFIASRDFLNDFAMASRKDASSVVSNERQEQRRRGRQGRNRGRVADRNTSRATPRPSEEVLKWSAFCQALFQSSEFRTIN